jgi:hypothetical protein
MMNFLHILFIIAFALTPSTCGNYGGSRSFLFFFFSFFYKYVFIHLFFHLDKPILTNPPVSMNSLGIVDPFKIN